MDRREFLFTTSGAVELAMAFNSGAAGGESGQQPAIPPGPLRVHAKNPRYFQDTTGRAVLLVGSHVWNNLVDMGRSMLYEVINEGGEQKWDWWVVETLREYERSKPKQHLIGITGHGAEDLKSMLASPADWISPGSRDGYRDDPAAWDGKKVSLLDTDHIWGVGGNQADAVLVLSR